jgi:alpha-D-ribose 1-methylphosphonate 5-phosphate C-P lyase
VQAHTIQKRHNGLYVGFMIDQMPNRVRKTAVDNSTDVICERKLCKMELLELAQNYGRNSRIVTIYNYDSVESLILEDLKYNIDTPEEFKKACRIRGFSDSKFKFAEQLKLELI